MKRILILMILFLPALAFADDHFRSIDGRWIDVDYGQTIRIEERRNFIRVKGLTRRNNWVRFDRTRNGRKFRDCNGNSIRIIDSRQLVYRNNNRGVRRFFERRGGDFNYWHNDRRRFRDRGFNQGYYRDWDNNRFDRRDNRNSRIQDLSGLWRTPLLNDRVLIENTNSGFRVRVGRRGKWTYYQPLNYSSRNFVDDRGNTMELFSDGTLLWKGGEGYKEIRLNRINR